jgi:hypothetical protein
VLRVTETDSEHADLLYALRGGSNNFGIVTRFTFRTFPQGRLWAGMMMYPLETKDQQIQALYDYCTSSSFDPSASLMQSFGLSAEQGTGCVNSLVYTKPEAEPDVFKPFTAIQPVYMNTVRELSLTDLTMEQDAWNQNGLWYVPTNNYPSFSAILMSKTAR